MNDPVMEPESSKAYATLRLSADRVDLAAITAELGIDPTHSHSAGDQSSQGATYRTAQWSLTTKGDSDSIFLRDHVELLLDSLSHRGNPLTELTGLIGGEVSADVFCFLSNPVSGAVDLTRDQVEGLARLGLAYSVDFYLHDSTDGGRSARDIRERTRSILNAMIRRPGMFGNEIDLSIGSVIKDLGFATQREMDLKGEGERLVARGGWSSTGVKGAFESLAHGVLIQERVSSTYAEICHRLGWLDCDATMSDSAYWQTRNLGPERVRSGQINLEDDLRSLFGEPSIRIGGSWDHVLGYAHSSRSAPIVWFDIADGGGVIACRIETEAMPQDFAVAPDMSAPSNFHSIKARRTAPLPYWAR